MKNIILTGLALAGIAVAQSPVGQNLVARFIGVYQQEDLSQWELLHIPNANQPNGGSWNKDDQYTIHVPHGRTLTIGKGISQHSGWNIKAVKGGVNWDGVQSPFQPNWRNMSLQDAEGITFDEGTWLMFDGPLLMNYKWD